MSTAEFSEEWLTGPSSTAFYSRIYTPATPPRAALVFVHGFIEHVGRYAHVFPHWRAAGVAVLAYDQRGFGRTALDATHRSPGSVYGKTGAPEQRADLQFVLGEARRRWPGVPLFLMGHSMGGGIVLSYCTQAADASALRGVLVTSPLILQAAPAPKVMRVVGKTASRILPNKIYPANVNPKDLSHDAKVGEEYLRDPLVIQHGTLRGIDTMLETGESLLATGYTKWPQSLPLLMIHGTDDKVCSHKASQVFHDKIGAEDKNISLYEGGFHELQKEPDGVGQRLVEECITWVQARLPSDDRDTTEQPTAKL